MVEAAPFHAVRLVPPAWRAERGDPDAAPGDELPAGPLIAAARALLAPDPDGGYDGASQRLAARRREGAVRVDTRAGVHPYDVAVDGRRVRGVVVALRVGGPDGAVGHEGVDEGRVADRRERFQAVPYDLGPLTAIPADAARFRAALAVAAAAARPRARVVHPDGAVHHWSTAESEEAIAAVRDALAPIPAIVADGHHRATAAARRGGGSGFCLAWVVDPDSGLRTNALHRRLPRLPADWRVRLEKVAVITRTSSDPHELARLLADAPPAAIALRRADGAVLVVPRDAAALRAQLPPQRSELWKELDTALVEFVWAPLLGVAASELTPTPDIDTPLGGPGAAGLFVLRPPPRDVVIRLALAGERLPAKSTSFVPKARTGLVLRAIDDPLP